MAPEIIILFLWIVTGTLIYIYYPVHKTILRQLDHNVVKTLCQTDLMRSDKCFKNLYNLYDHCPMSSFKQCTNNVYPVNRCNCQERSFELCPFHQQYSEKCFADTMSLAPDIELVPDYGPSNPRVGLYHAKRTEYDEFS
jgi:hypothetical protein